MIAAAKNYDVICLNMRSYLSQQEASMQRETNRFIEGVKAIVTSVPAIKPQLDKFIPQIFNYRLLALKWISQQADIDPGDLIEHAYPSLEALRNNPKLALLAENTLFALRCNSRVMKAIIGSSTSEEFSQQPGNVPVTTYEQFFGTLALSIPDQEAFQMIADFCHASLYIEFILLAAILIDEDGLKVSDKTIDELAFLIADAAQDYFAIATQMGILPSKRPMPPPPPGAAPIRSDEDQLLANLGLTDFAKNFQ